MGTEGEMGQRKGLVNERIIESLLSRTECDYY